MSSQSFFLSSPLGFLPFWPFAFPATSNNDSESSFFTSLTKAALMTLVQRQVYNYMRFLTCSLRVDWASNVASCVSLLPVILAGCPTLVHLICDIPSSGRRSNLSRMLSTERLDAPQTNIFFIGFNGCWSVLPNLGNKDCLITSRSVCVLPVPEI